MFFNQFNNNQTKLLLFIISISLTLFNSNAMEFLKCEAKEAPFIGKDLMENCNHNALKNIDRNFEQILNGRIPTELAINIICALDVKYLTKFKN